MAPYNAFEHYTIHFSLRYKQKFGETTTIAGEDEEQEYFNEDFTIVARVLDETFDEHEQQHYVFVKWRGLSYGIYVYLIKSI